LESTQHTRVQKGEVLRAQDIINIFDVSKAIAYRDIGVLLEFGIITTVREGHTGIFPHCKMGEVVEYTNNVLETKQYHPLLVVAIFTVVFLEIHPFQNGNGRLSRVLITLLLLQTGYAYVSYSSLERVIEKRKEGYYRALRQTQGTIRTERPNWQPWVIFFLRALLAQVRNLSRKVEREKIILSVLPNLSIYTN
jgi:Fic family protein